MKNAKTDLQRQFNQDIRNQIKKIKGKKGECKRSKCMKKKDEKIEKNVSEFMKYQYTTNNWTVHKKLEFDSNNDKYDKKRTYTENENEDFINTLV